MGVYDFDLERYIGLARRLGTDTERVEVKAASQGLPKSMAETLSAFSNTSGGVVILGLAERAGFQGVPGFKARAVADALAQMCGEKMEPPVRASVEIVEFEGSPVVVATVPELPPELKPCFCLLYTSLEALTARERKRNQLGLARRRRQYREGHG